MVGNDFTYRVVWIFTLLYQASCYPLWLENERVMHVEYLFSSDLRNTGNSQTGGEMSYLHLYLCIVWCFCYEKSRNYEFLSKEQFLPELFNTKFLRFHSMPSTNFLFICWMQYSFQNIWSMILLTVIHIL